MENSTFQWYQTGEQVKQRGAYVWFDLKGLVMKMNSIHMHSQPKSRRLLSIPSLATGLCFLLLSAYCTLAAGQVDYSAAASSPFVDPATIDRSIPTPASVIGHEVGEKAVRYDPLMRYLEALAASSDRIVLKPFGETHEGRTLVHAFVTSAQNQQRLEQIKEDNGKLTDPRKLPNTAAGTKLIENLPAIALMTYAIHGDELSSTDAAMQLAYQLVAGTDDETKSLLEQVVVIIDPLQNPDGRERYLAAIEQRTGLISATDGQHIQHNAPSGRTNHYRFDMNRDGAALVTKEAQARMKVTTAWNPHFMVDSHEMGSLDTYLMEPPRQPLNPLYGEKDLYWRELFGFEQGAAFDERGWSYYAKDWNTDFAAIYNGSWAGGAIAMLYEQAGTNSAAYKQETGHLLTYRETVHHQLVSSLTNLNTLKNNRLEILREYYEEHVAAVNGDDELTGTFLMPPHADRERMKRFITLLDRSAIEHSFAQESVRISGATDIWGNKTGTLDLPVGTLVVKSAQPHRRVMHLLLRFDIRPDNDYLKIEREELENGEESRLYDVSAWNFPMAYGLESYWVDTVTDVKTGPEAPTSARESIDWNRKPKYGYIVDFASAAVYDVMVRLFDQGCHLRAAIKPFDFDGHRYQPGALVLRGHENPENLGEILQELARDFDVTIRPAQSASVGKVGPDLGGPKFILLQAPRVALATDSMSSAFGAVWHLLDYRLKMRVSPIESGSDLRKYNVLVLTESGAVSEDVKKWVAEGGTLIALGRPAYEIASGNEISSVRMRRDVLDELALYEEDLQREQQADAIEIDFDDLWGDEPGTHAKKVSDADKAKEEKSASPMSGEELERLDEWQRRFSPFGVFLKARIDERQWLGFGLGEFLPVLGVGDKVMMSKLPAETPVRLVDEDNLRLSGLLWPEARQRLANSAFATVESYGRGQVILFASNPTHRGWYPGMERLFLNSVLLGPGMGTDQGVPW